MLRPADAGSAAGAWAAPAATRPTAPTSGQAGAFAPAFARLHGEIVDSIRNGFGHGQARTAMAAGAAMANLLPSQLPAATAAAAGAAGAADEQQRRGFLESIAPWTRQAAAALGVSPALVAAHAALESGWGRQPPRTGDGGSSHNLFGIKAGSGWSGASVEALTREATADGGLLPVMQRFRAYGDYASAFADYVRLLRSPRYAGVRGAGDDAGAFAAGLVRGGYATDPDYAAKLRQIAGQVQRLAGG